jgi:hypothetical protein
VGKIPIKLPGCELSPAGLKIGDISFDQWDIIGGTLNRCESGVTWWIGDWINFGEGKWEQGRLQRAKSILNMSYKTLAAASYIARSVEFSRRHENLSIAHHWAVAPLDPIEQTKWLALAERNKLSHRRLRASIVAGKLLSDAEFETASLKSSGVISLTGLSVKFKLLLAREPIDHLDQRQLRQRHEELQPFVETDRRILERMEELNVAKG